MTDKRVTYYADGDGRWIRRDWVKQCAGKVFMSTGQCQGSINHEGPCWAYSPSGWLQQSCDEYSTQIPPGHADYIHPLDMQDKCHRHSYNDSEVTDQTEIDRLNRGELNDGESMLRPSGFEPGSANEGDADDERQQN